MQIKIDTQKVIKSLEKYKDEVEKEVKLAVLDNAKNIEFDAKNLAPVDNGDLRQGIYSEKTDEQGLSYKVAAGGLGKKYAPYQEFGTGTKVDLSYLVEAGMPTNYAMQFKGRGIKEVNLKPQPFLFPAFVKNSKTFLKDLKDILKRVKNKV